MFKVTPTRSVRSIYPARLLLIDYGLNERTIQGICHGLDQLFSIVTTYAGIQHLPMFGLIVNGQNQSEIFLPLSSTSMNDMELQIALYKLQLLAQKWSIKSVCSSSWHSAFELISIEINDNKNHITDVELTIVTNRSAHSIIADIQQFIQNHQIDRKKIELLCVNDDNDKQSRSSSDLINVKYVLENKYSICLYFKSWLLSHDHDNEHVQLYLPGQDKTDQIDQSWHLIRCDIKEILIDPHHHTNHERFFIYHESTTITSNPSLPVSIYQLKGLNFIKQANHCLSMIFGMPFFLLATICLKWDAAFMKKNENTFHTLINYLRQNELMLICRLNENQLFSGHFIVSVASEHCLIIRSIASSELLLPFPSIFAHQIVENEKNETDENLLQSLSHMKVESEEYNPLYYESRRSRITLNTNLL